MNNNTEAQQAQQAQQAQLFAQQAQQGTSNAQITFDQNIQLDEAQQFQNMSEQ